MSQTIPRNPVIPNGPGDLRTRFPSQPNPYNIPAYPAPPSRPYSPVPGTPSLNPFANRNGVALPGVPKTPGGNYVGAPLRQPYTYPGTRPHPGNWQPPTKSWAPREPLWRPGQPVQSVPRGFNWSINTQSRPNLPALPRSPGLNPRFPRWMRIPPRMRIPLIGVIGNLGLGLLRPSPADILFGIIPDAMESARPWVWEQLGIRNPGGSAGNLVPPGSGGLSTQYSIEVDVFQPNGVLWRTLNTTQPGPITFVGIALNDFGVPVVRVTGANGNVSLATVATGWTATLKLLVPTNGNPDVGLPSSSTASPIIPTNGIQAGTPPYSGMPAASRGQRPATDPRGYRPDLQPIPQTSAQPRAEAPQQSTSGEEQSGICRFSPTSQAEIDSLRNQIRNLQEQNRDLQDQLTSANQATFYQVPYVVENEQGQRVRQSYPLSLKGLIDTTAVAALSNQTADWALQTGDKTEKIYQILGGDGTWGDQPTPLAQTNPDALLRSQPVINEQGLGSMVQAMNLPQLFTQTQSVLYQRQGLQQFPITVQHQGLNSSGLLPDVTTPQVFNTATDVQVTTSSKGFAVIKGLNEVITKTQQTIQYLRVDRLLNLLNTAATLHNAMMLSRNLLETLGSTISNVLATFGLRDATGQPFDFGSILGNTVQEFLKSILGESTVNGINENWNKANRILSAASGIIFALRSIGDSILSALSIGFGWVARIGNALELAGVIHERFWNLVNPTPNFSNRFFTGIEAAENLLGNIDSVAGEAQSITESVGDIARNREEMGKMLSGENQPNASNIHAPTNTQAIQTKADSQGAPVTLPDVVPPSPN